MNGCVCFAGRTLQGVEPLSFADLEFANAKPAGLRLGLAVQLKFFFAAYRIFGQPGG